MNNWVRLFVSPFGAIGRRTFQHGVVVIAFVNLLPVVAFHDPMLVWPMLATLWPTICVTTKRLHTHGASGWVQTPQRAIVAGALLATLAPSATWLHNPWLVAAAALILLTALLADALMFLFLVLSSRQPPEPVAETFS